MSVKDVGSAASIRAMPAARQDTARVLTGVKTDLPGSVEVSLSQEAISQASARRVDHEPESSENSLSSASTASEPGLASNFFSDPATANDAPRFLSFLQHATVAADDMADALHQALISPAEKGDYTTNAMDLALTQGKLNRVVETYVPADYQQQASDVVAQFIDEKATQADQLAKVALSQATRLAQSLGNREQARHHQDAIAQLTDGTHSSQAVRREMLGITANSADSDSWFSSLSNWVNENRFLPYTIESETRHVAALQTQWQAFVGSLKTGD
ncbi:hypothetical protein [Phytobacter sp. V91]|uniref:hypothetical protein n=1 Tax=Phytobacter sp. V91 TaxID=3369425 RepID=UPI003F5EF4F0